MLRSPGTFGSFDPPTPHGLLCEPEAGFPYSPSCREGGFPEIRRKEPRRHIRPVLAFVLDSCVRRPSYYAEQQMRAQARRHSPHSGREGKRRLHVAVPNLRHRRPGKGDRKKCTIGAVGRAGACREIALEGADCFYSPSCRGVALSKTVVALG